MRFIHLADLHIGRKVNEFDLLDDQRAALAAVLREVEGIQPDVALIAGDVYDKAVPSAAAVAVLDEFLTVLSRLTRVCLIGGNHDSQERLSFGNRVLAARGLHIAGHYEGHMMRVTVPDRWGEVDIYLMPFFRPREVARFFAEPTDTYDGAVRAVIARENIDFSRRSVLIAHQFVTSGSEQPEQSDSETSVGMMGGLENVDASAFEKFHYVALGHLHGPQQIGRAEVRYAGSLLKYSFSECRQVKRFVVGEIDGAGHVALSQVPIPFVHDMREIRGELSTLIAPDIVSQADPADYLHVTLTDQITPTNPRDKLESVYPNVMKLDFAEALTRAPGEEAMKAHGLAETPLSRFQAFYALMNGCPLSEAAAERVRDALARAGEEDA